MKTYIRANVYIRAASCSSKSSQVLPGFKSPITPDRRKTIKINEIYRNPRFENIHDTRSTKNHQNLCDLQKSMKSMEIYENHIFEQRSLQGQHDQRKTIKNKRKFWNLQTHENPQK